MSDIERLRADLEAMERLWESVHFSECAIDFDKIKSKVRDKIARLEAEQAEKADPWRKAKSLFDVWERAYGDPLSAPKIAASYVAHLTAENARLTKRVAELDAAEALAEMVQMNQDMGLYEAAGNPMVDDDDVPKSWPPGNPVADMQPPFEGPIVGLEPILDPARVLATACDILEQQGWVMNDRVREDLKGGAKPYKLKESDE